MKEYKRLTKRLLGSNAPFTEYAGYNEVLQRLAELEDKIENGTLVELPCKVGDRIWVILGNNIFGRRVKSIVISQHSYIKTSNTNGWKELEIYHKEEFGVKWFLTKAEAEAKLKEQQNER
jgi:tetrahydromethanopterin S-methyltransferase subunit G